MAGKGRAVVQLTDTVYNEALAAWLEQPRVSHVVYATGISRAQAKQLVEKGIPELDLPPLPAEPKSLKSTQKRKPPAVPPPADRETAARHLLVKEQLDTQVSSMKDRLKQLEDDADSVEKAAEVREAREDLEQSAKQLDIAERKLGVEAKRIANVEERAIAADNIERSATEAAIARKAMSNVLNIGTALEHLTEKLLEAVERGEVEIPDKLDAKTITALSSSVDKLTSAMERAIKIEKGRAGEPEKNLGIQIGILLNACTEAELDGVIDSGGALPSRIRNTITAKVLEQDP